MKLFIGQLHTTSSDDPNDFDYLVKTTALSSFKSAVETGINYILQGA